jgi:flagellar motor switch protein FliN/FliY
LGQVHVLDRRVDQPVDVLISERLVARGEIVSVGDKFGVRLTDVLPATSQ